MYKGICINTINRLVGRIWYDRKNKENISVFEFDRIRGWQIRHILANVALKSYQKSKKFLK